jgi:branched-chain amino acid transport system substrate-binding protein
MRMSKFFLAACLLGFVLGAGGCGGGQNGASDTIVLGHLASMTGDTATFGTSCDEGLRLALEQINADGGVLGKQVVVITEDDRSVTSEARTAANKLITRDQVVALIGEIASSRSIAAAPVAQVAQIPMLSPGSTNPKVTEEGDYIFRSCFIDPFQGTAMATFAMENLGLRRFAILYANNSDYSVGLRDFFKEAVLANGGEIVAEESYAEKSDKDFKAQLTKIKETNPEAIYACGYYTEAGLIARQARELGITVPLLGGDGWDSDVTVQSGGQAVEGAYFTNHYAPDQDRPEVQKFVADYKARYNGKVPDAMAILGYDAMRLMADAIERAGSTDGAAIRNALAATQGFPGASGTITMDEHRNANKPAVVVQIRGGKFEYVTEVAPK